MTLGMLPPQAYTKETLAQAYTWLKDQPERITRLATTPDTLVSLYLKARRGGRLDNASDSITIPPQSIPVSSQRFESELRQMASELKEPISLEENKNFYVEAEPKKTFTESLGNECRSMIEDIKKKLHLESDLEIMRMLITLGYYQLRTILPNFHSSQARKEDSLKF